MTRAKIEGKVRHLISSMQWPGVTILNLPPQKLGNFPVEKRKKGRKKFMQWTQPNQLLTISPEGVQGTPGKLLFS